MSSVIFIVILFYHWIKIGQLVMSATNCKHIVIQKCPHFNTEKFGNSFKSAIAKIIDADQIAQQGHIGGIQPIHYDLNLTFINMTHYHGSVDIEFQTTDVDVYRIVIHQNDSLKITDYSSIIIKPLDCADNHTRNLCIRKAIHYVQQETLILDLTTNLTLRSHYTLSFPLFSSRAISNSTADTKEFIGLYDAGRLAGSRTVVTLFQPNQARRVFPCFDHPKLKAKFSLCMEFPGHLTAAANMPLISSVNLGQRTDRKRECYETTPLMSTYLLAIALMENYVMESIECSNIQITFELFAPASNIDKLRWMLSNSVSIIEYFQKQIVSIPLPIKRIGLLTVYSMGFGGFEGYGLITFHGSHMENTEHRNWAENVLAHEIVHQWIGDLVTVSNWRYVCLQEGLTTYFGWTLANEALRKKQPITNFSKEKQKTMNVAVDNYEALGSREYDRIIDIVDHCYKHPNVFFFSFASLYGPRALEVFATSLTNPHASSNADLVVWDDLLYQSAKVAVSARTTSSSSGPKPIQGYLERWFSQPGPISVMSWEDNNEIHISQRLYRAEQGGLHYSEISRTLPIAMLTSSSSPPLYVIVNSSRQTLKVGFLTSGNKENYWYLLDADSLTMTRTIYQLENYQKLFRIPINDKLTEWRITVLVYNFCMALKEDVFPWSPTTKFGNNQENESSAGWNEMFNLVLEKWDNDAAFICRCCVASNEEITKSKHEDECKWRKPNDLCSGRLRIKYVPKGNIFRDQGGCDRCLDSRQGMITKFFSITTVLFWFFQRKN